MGCPIAGRVEGGTNYRGPNNARLSINRMEAEAPVMADRDGNHGTEEDAPMNYAIKSGSCHRTPRNSAVWREGVAANVID